METGRPAEGASAGAGGQRKIIDIDMDAFYASVEQRDNSELRGKPVAVGGSRERGVVAAASYEARKFGVHSAMPSITAKRKCPDLIFVKPRFDAYKAISLQIRDIFAEYRVQSTICPKSYATGRPTSHSNCMTKPTHPDFEQALEGPTPALPKARRLREPRDRS